MGNNQTRPERGGGGSSSSAGHLHRGGPTRDPSERANIYSGRGHRGSRPDLSFLGINVSSVTPEEYVEARRETKAEREARRLEKERTARLKERERSMKEEHVDGGYLVTQGVYTGTEDFNKSVVRQLMIERRLAPFWRGLDDHSDTWTEYQIVCAARGLPIPAPDDIPPDDFLKPPHPSAVDSPKNASVSNLTVPIAGRSPSSTSDVSATLSPSHPAFSIPSPTTPTSPSASSSTFRTRSKTLASLTTSRNSSQTEVLPREIMLPNDPYVNGQPIEVALYKEAPECIICMLSYPPWINHTRCCDQPICSECFVQIKRPDPHPPEHEQPDAANPNPQPAADAETLVSEPSCCPYCQQAEFGVTYEPPPFRRGLVYAMGTSGPAMGSVSSAMSSTSSLNSNGSPQLGTAPTGRRRATSLAANSPAVITTDRVRPDWATKLANARNHAARRAAAATALHTAAYLMNSNGTGSENRSFTFTPRGRFSRNQGSGSPAGGETPTNGPQREDQPAEDGQQNRRRTRIDDLEDMMLMEAIRLSLAAEEDRKRKEDKDARKREKKKEKEAKKAEKAAEKAAKRSVYSNGSSASGSALSLSLPVIGRRRGNSASSVLKDSTIAEEPGKGKGIDRGIGLATASAVAHATGQTLDLSSNSASQSRETAPATSPAQPPPSPLPATNVPEKPSHLRHISNASSAGSSSADSGPGTPNNGPRASSSTLGSVSGAEQGDESNTPDREGEANKDTESMFNFSSLAAMIGQDGEEEDSKDAARHVEYLEGAEGSHAVGAAKESTPTQEINDPLGESMATLKPNAPEPQPQAQTTPLITDHLPHVMVTPETPAAETSAEADSKQLGVSMGTTTYVQDVTQ